MKGASILDPKPIHVVTDLPKSLARKSGAIDSSSIQYKLFKKLLKMIQKCLQSRIIVRFIR